MKISITGRGIQIHDNIKEYAEQKASKLDRYFDQLQKIEIVVSPQGDAKAVEMIAIPRRGQRIVGQSQHDDPFAAVDLVVDKMSNQLRKLKDKKQKARKRSGRLPPPPVPSDLVEDEPLETYDDVVDKHSEKYD